MAFSFGQPAATAGTSGLPGNPGAPASSPFGFGGNAPQTQQQQPSNSLFGGQQQQSQQQQSGNSFFGGQQQQQQPANSLLGAQQQQPSISLFGNSQQQQPSSSLFGNAPQQQQASSSLFGNAPAQQQQQQTAPNTSLFGSQATATGGLFGTSTATAKPLFGQSTSAAQQPNPLTLSQLGGPASYTQQPQQGGMASGTGLQSNMNALDTASRRLGLPLNDKIEQIRAAWDMQNIQTCQFLYYFFNAIPTQPPNLGEAALSDPNFGRRQDAVGPRHDALWLQSLRENPDRSKLVPVLAVGFPDLKVRVEAQQAESARQSVKLGELQKRLDELTSKHSLSNSVRISAISRKQTSLHQRLMGLAKRSHLLIPALRGHSITRKEEQLRSLLQSCELELETISSLSGGASGSDASAIQHRLRGRINELWAVLGTLKAKREATTAAAAGTGNAPLEWAVVDDSAIEDVVKILAAQQQGLDHLSTTLQTDARNLDTIIKGLDGVELVGVK